MGRSSQRGKNIPGEQEAPRRLYWKHRGSSVSVGKLSGLEVSSYENRKLVLGICDKDVTVNFDECYF